MRITTRIALLPRIRTETCTSILKLTYYILRAGKISQHHTKNFYTTPLSCLNTKLPQPETRSSPCMLRGEDPLPLKKSLSFKFTLISSPLSQFSSSSLKFSLNSSTPLQISPSLLCRPDASSSPPTSAPSSGDPPRPAVAYHRRPPNPPLFSNFFSPPRGVSTHTCPRLDDLMRQRTEIDPMPYAFMPPK